MPKKVSLNSDEKGAFRVVDLVSFFFSPPPFPVKVSTHVADYIFLWSKLANISSPRFPSSLSKQLQAGLWMLWILRAPTAKFGSAMNRAARDWDHFLVPGRWFILGSHESQELVGVSFDDSMRGIHGTMPYHALNVSQPWDRVPYFMAAAERHFLRGIDAPSAATFRPTKNLAPKKIRLDVFLLCSTFSGIMEKALDKWWPGCKLSSDSYFPLWEVFCWEETQDDSWKMVTSFSWCSHFLGTFLGGSGSGGVHPNWPWRLDRGMENWNMRLSSSSAEEFLGLLQGALKKSAVGSSCGWGWEVFLLCWRNRFGGWVSRLKKHMIVCLFNLIYIYSRTKRYSQLFSHLFWMEMNLKWTWFLLEKNLRCPIEW